MMLISEHMFHTYRVCAYNEKKRETVHRMLIEYPSRCVSPASPRKLT